MIKIFLLVAFVSFSTLSHAASSRANFGKTSVSHDTHVVADWIVQSDDNKNLPFVIIDKINAKAYAFTSSGHLIGSSRALLGIAFGDNTAPGIGDEELSDIPVNERTTPAGRFVASLGTDSHGKDIVWVDYDAGVALHRVITTNPKERRLWRLSTPFSRDKRISYGCINVPIRFYEKVIHPIFKHSTGIVYILPDTQPLREVFDIK